MRARGRTILAHSATHGVRFAGTTPTNPGGRTIAQPVPSRSPVRRALTALSALVFALSFVAIAPPTPARAAATSPTSSSIAATMYGWINQDRAALGLRPLQGDFQLHLLANDRAANMAKVNVLTHSAAGGNVGTALTGRGIQWYGYGEDIGYSSYPWGVEAARHIYDLFRASPPHWTILMSPNFNYIGAGFAYRASNGRTYASLLFTDAGPNRTGRPDARRLHQGEHRAVDLVRVRPDPSDAHRGVPELRRPVPRGWWRVAEPPHGRHEFVIDPGEQTGGHNYWVRVRASDQRGNLSPWSSELRVWVPYGASTPAAGCRSRR